MLATLEPQPKILRVWRVGLTCLAAAPALFCSLLFSPGSPLWWGASAGWLALFLLLYLYYLPTRFQRLSLRLEDDRFVLQSGVFYRTTRTLPFDGIQFLRVRSSPLHRLWNLASLIIVAPGGRMSVPGLRAEEAEGLAAVFFADHREKSE